MQGCLDLYNHEFSLTKYVFSRVWRAKRDFLKKVSFLLDTEGQLW